MIYLQLFITFFEIGIFGFGGGYSMLSLIQSEVVQHYHWLTTGEFTDIVAISQATPGPIGINSATYCGYTAIHEYHRGTIYIFWPTTCHSRNTYSCNITVNDARELQFPEG